MNSKTWKKSVISGLLATTLLSTVATPVFAESTKTNNNTQKETTVTNNKENDLYIPKHYTQWGAGK